MKKPNRKKMIAPVIISIVVLVWLGIQAAVYASPILPVWFRILAVLLCAALAGVMIYVLAERIGEIRRREDDDLDDY